MKKLLLSFAAIGLLALSVDAQSCTPGANFVDSTYGVWPDTTQNFPPAAANVAYSTDLNFKVPSTVPAELSAQFAGAAIQSFTVTGVVGLPSGYNYACNIANCTYTGGANGCANIWGTTATTGIYPITIELDATVMISLLPGLPPAPTQVPGGVSFGGYKIIVGTAGLITSVVEPLSIYPNPSNGQVSIKGIVADELTITNLNGQVILSKNVSGQTQANLDLSSLNAGVYFVNTLGSLGKETIRFIKD
jgi:hypothetical protein